MPVLGSDVTSGVCWHSPAVDDDTEDNEANHSKDLDATQNELNLTITFDTEEVDGADQDEEYGNPNTDIDGRISRAVLVCPECDRDTGNGEFERQNDQPVHGIVPSHCETPGRIDEPNGVVVEGSSDRIQS